MTKVFTETAETVVAGAACTWCGSRTGQRCSGHDMGNGAAPHAQRWYDYWNETHDPRERIAVYRRGRLRPSR